MNKAQRVIATMASALIFPIAGFSQAQAAEVAINGPTDWISTDEWEGVLRADFRADPVQTDNSYRLNGTYSVDVTDYQAPIDRFTLYLDGSLLGTTGPKIEGGANVDDVITAWEDSRFSKGTFTIGSGLLTIFTIDGSAYWGQYGIRFNNLYRNTGNALRLDEAGVATEKNHLITCTPGKYTFLNGGSTPEIANIQSFVYTLLINGKAVSTLSSDGFKSVASHMFPTIKENLGGNATLQSAQWNVLSWDRTGDTNYSAQCQVYATQSGGNIQSVTSTAYDSVALAAQAEAAAIEARNKEIISTWYASNEELAKKYRDRRLVGKP